MIDAERMRRKASEMIVRAFLATVETESSQIIFGVTKGHILPDGLKIIVKL